MGMPKYAIAYLRRSGDDPSYSQSKNSEKRPRRQSRAFDRIFNGFTLVAGSDIVHDRAPQLERCHSDSSHGVSGDSGFGGVFDSRAEVSILDVSEELSSFQNSRQRTERFGRVFVV